MRTIFAAAALAAFFSSSFAPVGATQDRPSEAQRAKDGCIQPQDRSAAVMAAYKNVEISSHLGVEMRRLLVPLKVKERLDIWPVDLAVVYHVPGSTMVTVDFFYRACGVASLHLTADDYRLLIGLPAPAPPMPGTDT